MKTHPTVTQKNGAGNHVSRRDLLSCGLSFVAMSALNNTSSSLARFDPSSTPSIQQASKPNILFMLTDNLGYGVPSCYNGGILDTPTPRIDKLAAEGLRLTNFNIEMTCCHDMAKKTLPPKQARKQWIANWGAEGPLICRLKGLVSQTLFKPPALRRV
jgi:hypothetical protein